MFFIFGLGNPGRKHEMTRHNVGYELIDKLAYDYNISMNKLKFKSIVGEGMIKGKKVMLIKPTTFMNLSGEAVSEVLRFYKEDLNNILIAYDDTAIDLGTIRLRKKGSSGGHNGMKSIINHLNGQQDFLRLRIGIGAKPEAWDLADYVLSHFVKNEKDDFIKGITLASECVETMLESDVDLAMNRFNPSSRNKKNEKNDEI